MSKLRNRFERFCYRNRNWGIPNLMLYVSIGAGMVYLFTLFTQNALFYNLLSFDRAAILRGEVWRLISYPLTYAAGSPLLNLISLVCYYSLAKAMENLWGTLRFNLYYFTGIVLMDVYCLVFGGNATVLYLNTSLFLAYATLYPNHHFLLLLIIPVKAWIFAVFDLGLTAYMVITGLFVYAATGAHISLLPQILFPLVALLNYFLFFGKDVANVFPISWRANFSRLFRKRKKIAGKPTPFPSAGSYATSVVTPKAAHNHQCTVCGRTDVSNPELEFRYCSRCAGYYCYCEDHISNHAHIE